MTTTALGMPALRRRSAYGEQAEGLRDALGRVVRGEVRFDAGSRGAYSTDASNYRQVPVGVVVPRDTDDIEAAVTACREHDAPVLGRGGGTSLAGQCCNVAVVLDCSKYLRSVVEVDPDRRQARVQPGCTLDDLRAAVAPYGLTFAPDPATHEHCTLGGMIGNDSCGVHSVLAGKTVDNVDELEVLTYDGLRARFGRLDEAEAGRATGRRAEILHRLLGLRDRYGDLVRSRYPDIPRRVSGYNLDALLADRTSSVARALVGTESTCALTLEATVALVPWPAYRVLVVLGYPDVVAAGRAVPEVMATVPMGLEGFDDVLVDAMRDKGFRAADTRLLPAGGGWLYAEYGADSLEEARAAAGSATRRLGGRGVDVALVDDPGTAARLWQLREAGLGVTARLPGKGDAWPGWEDSAVPPERLGDYLADLRGLYDHYGYAGAFYGHFGQGCLHTRTTFDLRTEPGVRAFRSFLDEAADLVVSYGGSLSGEHGDGQARAALLPKMFGPELVTAFEEFKAVWDPAGRMNPGKVVAARDPASDLRLGPDYAPRRVRTHFAYADDGGDFARATLRCVGVGSCRRTSTDGGDVMCPSYLVTREEEHSTRGRSRLLFELLDGRGFQAGWRSRAVKNALDLCLACKGCKSDCPVNVDMATYKAEFLAHYYAGRLRPRSAYAMGFVMSWLRLAARAPRLVNRAGRSRLLAGVAKRMAGVAPGRELPRVAAETFQLWWHRRGPSPVTEGPRVLLWPDTFSNFLAPEVGRAAVRVLEAAGCVVVVPRQPVCCGRPLYDYGLLGTARRRLTATLDVLRAEIRAGTPVVVLEPSCAAVFRDELPALLPHDPDARRLADATLTLADYLQRHRPDWAAPPVGRAALVQTHCHQHAVLGFDAERVLFERAEIDAEVLRAGCCGMAGAFGFEASHYAVSLACAERVLLPAVQAADPAALLIADGFSCREQVRQAVGRRPLHLAEVLAAALSDRDGPARSDRGGQWGATT